MVWCSQEQAEDSFFIQTL